MDPFSRREAHGNRTLYILLTVTVALVFFLGITQMVQLGHTIGFLPPTINAHRFKEAPLVDDLDGDLLDRLTTSQCMHEYPKLYKDIDTRQAYWKARKHTIDEFDVDISWRDKPEEMFYGGAMRILIHDNTLRILQSVATVNHPGGNGFYRRAVPLMAIIERALESATASGEILPTVEAAVLLEDISHPPSENGTHSFWTFTSHYELEGHKRRWLVPNFDFWYAGAAGTWHDARRRAMQHDMPFEDKIPKAVWRGEKLFNNGIRGGLFNVTEGKEWADVKDVSIFDESTQVNRLSPDDYCRYAMTIHTEGITYSGRLKFLLNCNSLLLSHELMWLTYWYHLLEKDGPHQNHIHFDREWSGIDEKVEYYLNHPEESQRVIENAVATFRNKYLSRAAQSCYMRHLIRSYSEVAWEPAIYRPIEGIQDTLKLRGIPFEVWLMDPKDFKEEDL